MTAISTATPTPTPTPTLATTTATAQLAAFAADLRFDAIPAVVLRKTEDLLVDWFGSAVAGKGARPVESITRFAASMGPAQGGAEVLINRSQSSAYFAAMANAAASHVAEQDDVHNGSVFHPATVVFPVALAMAQTLGSSGQQLLTAAVAGYEVGIRVGEFLGRSHYKVFHTTGTAGTLAAAATAGSLLGLNAAQMQHAFGSAGTQSAGLWEFLRTAADSKQLHTAHAAAAGLMSACLAGDGFTGAAQILDFHIRPQPEIGSLIKHAVFAQHTAELHAQRAGAARQYHAFAAASPARSLRTPAVGGILEIAGDGETDGSQPRRQPVDPEKGAF